jgi:hypothetical protein
MAAGRIVLVTVPADQGDFLQDSLDRHIDLGVDVIMAVDGGSTDGSRALLFDLRAILARANADGASMLAVSRYNMARPAPGPGQRATRALPLRIDRPSIARPETSVDARQRSPQWIRRLSRTLNPFRVSSR